MPGPQRLIRALGIETGNPILTNEQRSSVLPSLERAPHFTENPPKGGYQKDYRAYRSALELLGEQEEEKEGDGFIS